MQIVLMRLPTFESWDMGSAPQAILRGHKQLLFLDDFHDTCIRCGCPKAAIEMVASDAGQFYEQVSPALAISSLNACFYKVAEETCENTVTQVAGRGVIGHVGGATPEFVPRTKKLLVVRFSELLMWFSLIITSSFVQILDLIFHVKHTPIGSPFGKVSVSCVAGWLEFCWVKSRPYLHWKWWPFGVQWHRVMFCLRYTDDLFTMSRLVCSKCQFEISSAIYPFSFDISDSGSSANWTDIRLRGTVHGKILLAPKTKNSGFAWGRDELKEKDSLPPPYFPRGVRTDAAIMKGMMKRWFQITPHSHIVLRCAWQKTVEYLVAGYSPRYMRSVWGSLPDTYIRRELFRLLDSSKTTLLRSPPSTS